MRLSLSLLALVVIAAPLRAQDFKAVGAPSNPKVEIAWNRYYDYDGITEICRRLAKAHPDYIRMESIGRSTQGREMWALTVSDFRRGGPVDRKPAFYIDGNIHSNEIQGTEVALYTAWYLAEMASRVGMIDTLLQTRTFYILPTINPDAREDFMKKPNTMHSPRSGMAPRDDDGDGLVDEDGPDDLDGNGSITQMRRRDPNGRWRPSEEDPRMLVRAKPGEQGIYEMLDEEGIDNDGDGQVNEDGPGFYDPNRDWGWNWQPRYVQYGADRYPFSLQENRVVRDFVLAHPNIAGAQSYHNAGGMILRPPGAEEDASMFTQSDIEVYDAIGRRGEQMLPGYKYMTTYKDLYTTYGGEVDWFYGMRGVFAFTNELWSSFNMFGTRHEEWFGNRRDLHAFDRFVLFGEGILDWTPIEHPQYGAVEVGGATKNYTRINPSFLIEEMAHRNMAFTIYHAWQMPQLEVQRIATRRLDGGLTEVTATVANTRMVPTHTDWDVRNRITRPDWITLTGGTVLSGALVTNRDLGLADEQRHNPARVAVATIAGHGYVTVRWIVKGDGPFAVTVDSEKGGVVTRAEG